MLNPLEEKARQYMKQLSRTKLVSHASQVRSRNDEIIDNTYLKFEGRIPKERLEQIFLGKIK